MRAPTRSCSPRSCARRTSSSAICSARCASRGIRSGSPASDSRVSCLRRPPSAPASRDGARVPCSPAARRTRSCPWSGRSPQRSERSLPSSRTSRTGRSRREDHRRSGGRSHPIWGRSAAASRLDGTSDRSRTSPPPVSSSSTPARRSSPTSAHRSCPRAMSAGSGATATAPAPSRSTGRSTDRSRGEIPAVWRRRPSISAARSTRLPPAKPPSGAESTPSAHSCSSSSRASSTGPGHPRASTPAMPIATFRPGRSSIGRT